MTKTYVSKRFRTFRKPIRREFATGGYIPNSGTYVVGDYVPEFVINPLVTTWTFGGPATWITNAKSGTAA